MALKIPVEVLKILSGKHHHRPDEKFDAVRRHYSHRVRETGGCFADVLLCRTFVLKSDKRPGDRCSIRKDYLFISKMRSNKKIRVHFPESRLFGNILVQERCDRNPLLFRKYAQQVKALGMKFGVSDLHDYNIGWKKVNGEHTPVFIDVGFHGKPRKPRKIRGQKKLSWFLPDKEVEGLVGRYSSDRYTDNSFVGRFYTT